MDTVHKFSIAWIHPQSPSHLHDSLMRESHETYGSPTSVTWLQPLHQQTNTGTSTAPNAETHCYRIRTHDFTHSANLCHQPRLAVTCAWSWRICGIASAIRPSVKYELLLVKLYELTYVTCVNLWRRKFRYILNTYLDHKESQMDCCWNSHDFFNRSKFFCSLRT